MKEAARYAACIEILSQAMAPDARLDKTLANWGRNNRYAGSKDRRFIRDVVFDVVRNWRSYQSTGFEGARGAIVGYLISADIPLDDIFNGEGHSPDILTQNELRQINAQVVENAAISGNIPNWQFSYFHERFDDRTSDLLHLSLARAPIDLRVNKSKTTLEDAQNMLLAEDIETEVFESVPDCLRVVRNMQKIHGSQVYKSGLVELQDAGSQLVSNSIPVKVGDRVLDYCAGGGGKSLAMASRQPAAQYHAHDISFERMNDLSERSDRAGAKIRKLKTSQVEGEGPYDVVVLDVPCSGSGAWRRNPEGKWALTEDKLKHYTRVQAELLKNAPKLLSDQGLIAYITCSFFKCENENQIDNFLRKNPNWKVSDQKALSYFDGTDGLFVSILQKTRASKRKNI